MKIPNALLLALTIIGISSTSYATVYFSTSSTSGWNTINQQNGGTVQNKSGYFQATCNFKANSNTRFHSEAIKRNTAEVGQTRYYGFQFRFAGGGLWNDQGKNHVVWQIASDNGWWRAWGANGVTLSGRKLTIGQWNQCVIRHTYSTSGTGKEEEWLNGAKIKNVTSGNVWPGKPPRWSVGLYEPHWHKAAAPSGGLKKRAIDNRNCKIASSFSEAQ